MRIVDPSLQAKSQSKERIGILSLAMIRTLCRSVSICKVLLTRRGKESEQLLRASYTPVKPIFSLRCGRLLPCLFFGTTKKSCKGFAAGINTRGDWHGGFMSSLATDLSGSLAKQLNHQSLVAQKREHCYNPSVREQRGVY